MPTKTDIIWIRNYLWIGLNEDRRKYWKYRRDKHIYFIHKHVKAGLI